ncbi:D-arabinono-1,4-lactone oxidase [Massilia scottii]|uniref:D-arabinono-1,4-lactone oxidase n=1 Tax=Massilia scottii TaxID=3057166 RepID=UPI00279674E7|nr:D-arabinono-1,4-lactone oxidase [Massilia sp. CCM 9029]MDQ1833131.1 D-arabinono-1,4-lactone oxidase [Massilia sp. CCM 9029]
MSPLSRRRRLFLKAGAMAAAAGLLASRATPAAAATASTVTWKNWSDSAQCTARALVAPADEAAIAALLRASGGAVRCVGAGHSFTPLVPTGGTILSLDRLAGLQSHDKAAMSATLHGGTRLSQVSRQLDGAGLALRNLPDIDMQSLAGAISTATHGTGAALPALHADVIALRIVSPQGDVIDWQQERHADQMAAARVSLGSLGIITRITMRVVAAHNLRRKVWLKPVEEMLQLAPELARTHRHFEFYYLPFTGYAAAITHDAYAGSDIQMPPSQDEDMLRDLRQLRDWLGKFPQLRRWSAARLIDADLTEHATNRSFRLLSNVRPTRFNETECHVPREAGIACVRDVIRTLERRNEVFFPLEFRFVKADDAWLSPFYQRDSCSIAVHAAHGEAYDYLTSEIGPVFRKHGGRPHWGKLHNFSSAELAALYPRWKDFQALRQQMDPHGRMLNPHLRALFGVPA